MSANQSSNESTSSFPGTRPKQKLEAVIIGGVGGVMPTLCSIASESLNSKSIDILTSGHALAMGIYFFVSAVLCVAFKEFRTKEAFTLGIAAPAILMNIANGTGQLREPSQLESSWNLSPISVVYAQNEQNSYSTLTPDSNLQSQFILDLKRGLGFPVELNQARKTIVQLESQIIASKEQVHSTTTKLQKSRNEINALTSKVESLELQANSYCNCSEVSTNTEESSNTNLELNSDSTSLSRSYSYPDITVPPMSFSSLNGYLKIWDTSIGRVLELQQIEYITPPMGFQDYFNEVKNLKEVLLSRLFNDNPELANYVSFELSRESEFVRLDSLYSCGYGYNVEQLNKLLRIKTPETIANTGTEFKFTEWDIARLIIGQARFQRLLHSHSITIPGLPPRPINVLSCPHNTQRDKWGPLATFVLGK
ncbi:hypothetical protein HRJ45_16980 [Vibrio coralliilyticus]|uniref:hypothetical protein n=1 Tax=Vibrio coralliilyticus TaxID=190893 RepID=UPI001560EE3F|nr:hypothetical protein [Vibrio coralliilyticus]NRF27454.1 hypothetical protein [Vibrio coralliilyticus]NRF80809.1 hypothetical protein [Vibrio coralliilyticus]